MVITMEFDKDGILPELTKMLDEVGIKYDAISEHLIFIVDEAGKDLYSVLSPCSATTKELEGGAFVMERIDGFKLKQGWNENPHYKNLEETYKEILRLYINHVWKQKN